MAVIRTKKDGDYSIIDNLYLRDKKLSLKAKGLMTIMLSLPDDWEYSVNGLSAFSGEGKSSINSAVNELEKHGYLRRYMEFERDTHKFIGYKYDIFERPLPKQILAEFYEKGNVENAAEKLAKLIS